MIETKFKKMEVGMIPEDWEVVRIGDICKFCSNNTYSREQLNAFSGDVMNIHYGDILIKFGNILDLNHSALPYISNSILKVYPLNIVKDGDIIIADTAEDETVGKACEIVNVHEKKVVAGLHTIWLRPNENIFVRRFLGYYINSSSYHNQLLSLIQGTKVCSISKSGIANTFWICPREREEQSAIATALIDIDELISALDKKNKKKKLIKQGAMQQLLIGKKRLPGFGGQWVERKLGDCMSIGHGKDYKGLGRGDIPVYGTGGIMTYVDRFLYFGETVCIGRKGTIDKPIYYKGKIWTVDTLFYTHSFIGIVPLFLYYKFLMIDWLTYNEASGVPSLSQEIIKNISIDIPFCVEEQTAIATLLSDMDNEISALEARRDKYKLIKQGMMQKLLTGQIRLI